MPTRSPTGSAAGVLSSIVGIGAAVAGAGLWSLVAMELVRQCVLTVAVFRFAALSMAACVYGFVAWLGHSVPAVVSLLVAVPVGPCSIWPR